MREKTLEEVAAYFDNFFSANGGLQCVLDEVASDTKANIKLMLHGLREATTGGTPSYSPMLHFVERLCRELPYIALERDDGETVEFIDNFTQLLQNYANAANCEGTKRLADILSKMVIMRGSFTELLILDHMRTKQYDLIKGFLPESVAISRKYIKQLIGDDE